jgi:hypothetical protein
VAFDWITPTNQPVKYGEHVDRFQTLFDSCLYAATKLKLKFEFRKPLVGPHEEPKPQADFTDGFKEPKVYD